MHLGGTQRDEQVLAQFYLPRKHRTFNAKNCGNGPRYADGTSVECLDAQIKRWLVTLGFTRVDGRFDLLPIVFEMVVTLVRVGFFTSLTGSIWINRVVSGPDFRSVGSYTPHAVDPIHGASRRERLLVRAYGCAVESWLGCAIGTHVIHSRLEPCQFL